jgi:hypothetical protein
MHVLGSTKPSEYDKETTSNITLEGVAPQPKEEMPWMLTQSNSISTLDKLILQINEQNS